MNRIISYLVLCTSIVGLSMAFASSAPNSNDVNNPEPNGYLVATEHIQNAPGKDVAEAIQNLINDNPNRTIFFPDGEYLLGKPIFTPAAPQKSVSLKLADFAVFKATGDWKPGEAVVQLGGIHPANDTRTNGSNYSFEGGIIDGNGIANGISINGGRETAVRNVSIKHTVTGLHIKHGANSGSSDSDIFGVNIIGTGGTNSVGVLLEGYDNTLTNLRIGNVFVGVHLKSGGNVLRNIHPLYQSDYTDYQNSCGFLNERNDNWFDYCYSDQFGVGFRTTGDVVGFYHNCFCYWYAAKGGAQTAFKAEKKFNSIITNFRIGFRDSGVINTILTVGEPGGTGTLDNLSVNESLTTDTTYKTYLDGKSRTIKSHPNE